MIKDLGFPEWVERPTLTLPEWSSPRVEIDQNTDL
eukprot:COSAG05_NODE_3277_length_2183_cov_1.856046_2_plen_34_part_01